jgi:glycosyltransferase involved in cell wall biosynthesis
VLIVDDGSTDATAQTIAVAREQHPLTIRAYRQENRGPATARNLGVREARGAIILFLGDDIIAHPELLATHMRHHNPDHGGRQAVLGLTTWSRELPITPFMRYLEQGPQFDYATIARTPGDVPMRYFYTSNVSISREQLFSAGLFDETFPFAAQEDVELGYRLAAAGVRMIFDRDCFAQHYHPTSFEDACRRNITVGRATVLLAQRIPFVELRSSSLPKRLGRKLLVNRVSLQLSRHLASFIGKPALWSFALKLHMMAGVDQELQHQDRRPNLQAKQEAL